MNYNQDCTTKYLVESALLTHGLVSMDNSELCLRWPSNTPDIGWIEYGEIHIGHISEFVEFRARAKYYERISKETFDDCLEFHRSGALTASGTMELCNRLHIPFAVSCGIGGIECYPSNHYSPDLDACVEIPVWLIATSPKDMFDIRATIAWLQERNIPVLGVKESICDGYIFRGEGVELDKVVCETKTFCAAETTGLVLQGIPKENRIQDKSILYQSIREGQYEKKRGNYFHPAVNAWIDHMTQGESSRIQLDSIIANIEFTQKIVSER